MTYEALKDLLKQANELNNTGRFNEAERLAEQALAEVPLENQEGAAISSENVELHCLALLSLAGSAQRTSDFERTLAHAHAALTLAEEYTLPEIKAKAWNICGNVYYSLDSYDKALEYYAKALAAFEEFGENSSVAKVTVSIGNVYRSLGSYDKALEYYAKALATHEELGEKLSVAIVTGNIGIVYSSLGSYDKALEYFAKALATHEELGAKSRVALVTGNTGIVYKNLGSYDKALEYFAKALAIHEELGEKLLVARVTGNIGNVYLHLGSYDKALEYFAKTLAVSEELGVKSGVAIVTGNIGTVYSTLGSYDKALEYYAKTLAAFEELGEKSSVASFTGIIGGLYSEHKEYATALDYLKRALDLAEEIGDRRLLGFCWANIGNTLSAMGKKQEAMEYLLRALHLRRDELQTNEGVASNLIAIGALLAEQNKSDEALEKLEEALALAEELGEKAQAVAAHKELAAILKKKGKTAASYSHFEKYHNLEKEVQSEEAKKTAQKQDIDRNLAVERARARATQELLHNTLPPEIADRILGGERMIADHYDAVSVLFMDLVNFTRLAQRVPPKHLVFLLNTIFSTADKIMEKSGLEKIKTIGDAYMAVCGAPVPTADHAERTARAALELLDAMNTLQILMPEEYGDKSWIAEIGEIQVRIGLHCGSAVGGVIGDKKFTFDLWGDAVNTASRMESSGEAGKIHVSEAFKTASGGSFSFVFRGETDIKGKGAMRTFYLENRSKQ